MKQARLPLGHVHAAARQDRSSARGLETVNSALTRCEADHLAGLPMLNLSEAAKESGLSKSAVWRAVNCGRLPATRTFTGDYRIDSAELHRVFPPTDLSPIVSVGRDPTELELAEAALMQEQIERLFEVGRQIRKELDDAGRLSR
jgi:hypothetical protein